MTAIRDSAASQVHREGPFTILRRRVAASRLRRRRRLALLSVLAFVTALAIGMVLRLWRLGVSPAWQWDEAVYYQVSVNVQHGVLSEHSHFDVPWEPFLYQPPFLRRRGYRRSAEGGSYSEAGSGW